MADRQVWLIEPDDALRTMLRELFEEEHFAVRECRVAAEVLRGLLHGESGIVVADATQLEYVSPRELHNLGKLSNAVAVLLLSEGKDVTFDGSAEVGNCKVVYRPYANLSNLVQSAVELAESSPNFRYALAGVF